MKEINLTEEMKKTVQRCIWFESPEEAVKDTPRLAAYIPSLYPRPEDVGRFVGSSLTNLLM